MDTKGQILNAAESLMQTSGYFGFSFADIAQNVGIKKASIYYYFPAKAELGQAVIVRYREGMRTSRDLWDTTDDLDVWTALEAYLKPILQLGRTPDAVCLCGVLGGEFHALPPEMQTEVSAFFEEHISCLTTLFKIGLEKEAFNFSITPEAMAKVAFSMLEGSMLMKRARGDAEVFDQAVEGVMTLLRGSG